MVRAIPGLLSRIAHLATPRKQASRTSARVSPSSRSERHLLIDVSVVCKEDARTGIQRVVRGVLLQLMAMRLDDFCVRPVFATPKSGYRYASIEGVVTDGVRFCTDGGAVSVQAGDIFLGLDLAAHILPAHRTTIGRWKAQGVHVAIVIYDLLPVLQPAWFNDRMVRHFRRWLDVIADHADSVLCISAHVAQDFRAWIDTHAVSRAGIIAVHHVPLGHDLAATSPSLGIPDDGEAILATISSTPAMLMVGTVEPRKGYDVSLAAFERLWGHVPDVPYTLVIVGKPGWKTADLQARMRSHAWNGTRLFWFEQASDEFLDRLYHACSAVMVASRTEGFGLPIVEAQGYGKAVLVRDIPVFRELAHGHIVYFQDDAPLSLSRAIADVLDGHHSAIGEPAVRDRTVAWRDAARAWLVALNVPEATAGVKDRRS